MHYKELLQAHKDFYKPENIRAHYYDEYMKGKDWQSWGSTVPLCEVMKLFGFILGWEPEFQGDPGKFQQIYEEIYPVIKGLYQERIEDIDFSNEKLKQDIEQVFDKVAGCPARKRNEWTAASKILHTLLPNFFIMWDGKIRQKILGEGKNRGRDYAYEFLPKMQAELEEALKTCMEDNSLSREESKRLLTRCCDGKTLPKLIDQFNYVRYR